jgi:tetraacyldisaccharide 4'-kinase
MMSRPDGAAAAPDQLRRGPVPAWIGRVLEPVYAAAVARRNRRFDAGRSVVRLDRPVISVGNLSVGGTGKTPMVTLLVRELLEAGRRPCIAMRGYVPRHARGPANTTKSDEAELYRRLLPGVPIVAQPDRAAGLQRLFATDQGREVDCVVLDDGFQHRRLARDLDIVLLDASRDPFADRLLPAGWLREPVASLARAHAVVVTHAEMATPDRVEAILRRAAAITPRAVLAATRHKWTRLTITDPSGGEAEHAVDWLAGRRIAAVCAIGNPDAFLAGLRAAGADVAAAMVLPDHDRYDPETVRAILHSAAGAEAIVTTEKDWAKLGVLDPATWPCPVARPMLDLHFDRGRDDLLRAVLAADRRCEPVAPRA